MEDGTRHLRLCPDWGSNPLPFSLWDNAPSSCVTQMRNRQQKAILICLDVLSHLIISQEFLYSVSCVTPPLHDLAIHA